MAKFNSYFICTSPRSGSTLLCSLLATTGLCGYPESYFHDPSIDSWLEEFEISPGSITGDKEILRLIFDAARSKGSRSTNIFGLRLQRPSAEYFFKQLGVLHPDQDTDKHRIEAEFDNVCYLSLIHISEPTRPY